MNSMLRNKNNIVIMGVILALILTLSFYLQFSIMDRIKTTVLFAMGDLSSKGLGVGLIPTVLHSFKLLDWCVIAGFVFLFLAVIWLQAFRKGVGDFLNFIFETEKRTLIFLLFLGFLFFKTILAPGSPYFMDAPSHVSRAWFTFLNFIDGYIFPSWTNYYHNGFALFSHYGWLYYYIAGALNLVVHQIDLSCKIVTFVVSMADIYLFYVLGKVLFQNRKVAFTLALIFITANFFVYELMWTGALFYPLVILGALILFITLEKFFSKSWSLPTVIFVTALGANVLINIHLGYTSQIVLFFAVWALLRLVLFYPQRWKEFIGFSLASVAIAGILAAFVFLPTYFNIGDVTFYKAFAFTDPGTYRFWHVPFWQFLVPRPFFTPMFYDYFGIGLIGVVAVILIRSFKKPDKWLCLSLGMLLFTLLISGYNRNNILFFFALALVGIIGINKFFKDNIGALAVLFILLLADGLIFNNFNTYDNRGKQIDQVFDNLEKTTDGTKFAAADANTLHTGNKENNDVFMSPWLKVVGHRLLQPNAIMLEANKQSLYQYAITSDLLVSDVRTGQVSDTSLKALNLIGVKYLLFHNSKTYFLPPISQRAGMIFNATGPWVELSGTRALIWAPEVTAWKDLKDKDKLDYQRNIFEKDNVSHSSAPFHYRQYAGEYVKTLVQLENPALDSPTADCFVTREGQSEALSSKDEKAQVNITKFQLDSQTLHIDFSVDKPGFVSLPFAWFPYQKATLDGEKADQRPTAFNTICVKVAKPGMHSLIIGPSISLARIAGAWISGIGLVLFTGLWILWIIWNRRKKSGAFSSK